MSAVGKASFAQGLASGLTSGIGLGTDISRARRKAIADANELESAKQEKELREKQMKQIDIENESKRIANDEARQKAASKAKATTAMMAIGGDTAAATTAMSKLLRADAMAKPSQGAGGPHGRETYAPNVTGIKTIDSQDGLIPDIEFTTEDGQTHKWGRQEILNWMSEAYGPDHAAVVDGNRSKGFEELSRYQSELTDQLNSVGQRYKDALTNREDVKPWLDQYNSLLRTLGVVNQRMARMKGIDIGEPPPNAQGPQGAPQPGRAAIEALPAARPGSMTERIRQEKWGSGAGAAQPAISGQPGPAPQGQGAIAPPGQQPAAAPAYTKTKRNPKTGEVIGLLNGVWYDVRTGQPYQGATTAPKTL